MSYAKSLRNTLKDKNESLFNRLQPIEEATRSVLTYTASAFPYYTPHDFSHSINVEDILNWLVPDDVKPKMNEYEIFFLLIASWLHDWGMVASSGENPEEVRKQHHIRAEANFENLHDKIGLSLSEARITGRICRGHREEDILDPKYEDTFFGSGNKLIRIRFLTALLRIADEVDVTHNRTPEIVYYTLKPEGASKEAFEKHLSINGIGPIAPHKLRLSGVAKTPRGVEVIESVKAHIQSQIDSVKTFLAANGVMLDSIESQIDTRGFINKPIAFDLDKKTIVNLLIGSFLYSRTDTAFRELAQNAIDTCRLKNIISPEFVPNVEIEFDNEKISFQDNGIGMSFEEASEFFSRKGSSFYVSNDLKELLKGKEFDPINKFGIGVLSSFMIADKMVVDTKKENCAPCRFIIDDISEGWTYETGGRTTTGTKVTLFLNDMGKKIEKQEALRHYLKKVPVQVFVKNLQTNERIELKEEWTYNIPEVLETVRPEYLETFKNLKPDLILQDSNKFVDVTYYFFKDESIFQTEKLCFLLNHGVFVGNFNFYSESTNHWIALINCKSDIIDLKVSREDVVENGKYSEFITIMYDILLKTVKSHVEEKNIGKSDGKKFIAYAQLINHLFYSRTSLVANSNNELWVSEFFKHKLFPVKIKQKLLFLSGAEIMEKKFDKIVHYKLPLNHIEEHINAIGPKLWSKLGDTEAVIFEIPPIFAFTKDENEKESSCNLCHCLKSDCSAQCECTSLYEVVAKWDFEKCETLIDELLPSGSYFSNLPDYFRGLVVQAKPFEFDKVNFKVIDIGRGLWKYIYPELVGRELFADYPSIANSYTIFLENIVDAKLINRGNFVFDIDDPFLSLIISKSESILANQALKNMISIYFKALALHFVGYSSFLRRTDSVLHLAFIEKAIAELLDFGEYPYLNERIGKIADVYRKMYLME